MLISLPALENMKAKIDFSTLTLSTPGLDHQLAREGMGHLRSQVSESPIIVDPNTLSQHFDKRTGQGGEGKDENNTKPEPKKSRKTSS